MESDADIDKEFDSIANMILNARKVQIFDDEEEFRRGGDNQRATGQLRKDAQNASSTLQFELKSPDLFGRSILHHAALDHKSEELI